MKSTILLWNKALFTLQLRTVTWFSILLTLLLFVMLPISILVGEIRYPGEEGRYFYSALNTLSEFSFPFQLIVFAIFPVLLGIVLLNFTTKKEATYFMHSLPFTRQTILTNTYLAGVVALLSPIALTGIVLGVLRFVIETPFYSFGDLFKWMGLSTLILLFLFIVTVTIGIFVGNGFLHGGLTYTVIIVPALLIVLTLVNLQYYISGLALTSYTDTLFTKGIFFVRLAELYSESFTILEYVIYTLIAVFLVILSYVAFSKRPSEASDQSIVFPIVQSIFLYGLTFFAMLLGGLYFTEFLAGSFMWTMFGYVLGAFFAYTVLQMILQKAIRLSWPWKGFIGYFVVIILLLIPVNIGGAFYENKIPLFENVASVAIYSSYSYEYEDKVPPRMTDERSIDQVIELHQTLKDVEEVDPYQWNTITIDYALNDGKTLRREYTIPESIEKEVTKDLRNNDEFKQAYDPIYQLRDLDITYASVYGNYYGDDDTRISDPNELNTLIALLEDDLANNQSQILIGDQQPYVGELYFSTKSNRHDEYIMISNNYEKTMAWLIENDLSHPLLISENIDSVTVIQTHGEDIYMELDELLYTSTTASEKFPDSFETTDKNEIEELLNVGINYYDGDYVVVFDGGNDYHQYIGFDKDETPDFVLERLE
ncbi:hypothetical protein ACM26V_05160 [Salipaludibacillus sp. HK11]|uniref:hypothetical protein n=1 Tax=Salipaludibacillus sp. HK11 TaxID=3394320 RepID=UPI0039FCAD55